MTASPPPSAIKRVLPWLVAVAFFMKSPDTRILNTAVPVIARAVLDFPRTLFQTFRQRPHFLRDNGKTPIQG
jgi:hypothetical protein